MVLTIGIAFGFLALVTFAIEDIILKKSMGGTNPYTIAFYRGLFITATLFVYAFATGFVLPPAPESLGILLVIGLVGAVAYLAYLRGIEKGLVSIINPIAKSSVILTVVLSVLFFNERLAAQNVLGIALIVAGTVAASINWGGSRGKIKRSHLVKGAKYAVLTSLGWGVVYFLLKIPVNVSGAVVASVYFELFVFLFTAMIVAPMKAIRKVDGGVLALVVVAGVIGGVATLAVNLGLSTENVSVIAPIINSTPLLLAILGRIVLNERLRKLQVFGVLLITAGLMLVVA